MMVVTPAADDEHHEGEQEDGKGLTLIASRSLAGAPRDEVSGAGGADAAFIEDRA